MFFRSSAGSLGFMSVNLELKRMRLLCGLRQFDVAVGTGVALRRISGAETGRLQLTKHERQLIENFLRRRWAWLQQLEAGPPGPGLPLFDGVGQ